MRRPNWFTTEPYNGPPLTHTDLSVHAWLLKRDVWMMNQRDKRRHTEMINRFKRTFGEKP